MSCEHCDCEHSEETKSESIKDIIDRIEFAVGYAININMTNYYKREVMKDVIELYVKYWKDHYKYTTPEELRKARQEWKDDVLKAIDKIATAEDGLSSTKAYIEILADLL